MISTPDAEAGRGGRLGALEMRRRIPRRRSKPRRVRRAVRTPGPPDGPVGRSACLSAHARPSGRGPPVERRGVCNGRSERTGLPPRPARSKPINTARGTPLVWWTCVSSSFDKPRCREASRRVGPSGPLAFRAPSDFEGGQSWKTAYPGPVKNTGDESRGHSGARAIGAFTRVFDALWRANPESRSRYAQCVALDSGSGPSDRPGMTIKPPRPRDAAKSAKPVRRRHRRPLRIHFARAASAPPPI